MRKNNGQTEERMTREQELIFDVVLKHSQLTREQLESSSREEEIVMVRHLLMYLYRECLGMPYAKIGAIMKKGPTSNFDHTSVMHGCGRAKERLFTKETAFCYLHKKVMEELKEHGFEWEGKGCTLIVRYPKGFPIHEVINIVNQKYKNLTYEFV
jgi:chromosomal replication initiation ATPase DnaA